jgi:TolB protein
MNKVFSVLVLMGCLALAQRSSSAEFVVEVTRGQDNAVPIAIVPFAAPGVADVDVAQVVSNDLARSGRFKAMDRKDMVEQPHTGANITYDDWRRLGNDYVVVGLMTAQGSDRYDISFELYNVLNRQRLLGFQISANRPGLRLASHQIADMIFDKITGIRGAFATRIAYVSVSGTLPNRSYRLIVADADGENPHVVMQSNEPLMSPAWSPDGQSLAYVSFEHRLPTVYVQYLKTGQGGCQSGSCMVTRREEARPHLVDPRRQSGCVRDGSGDGWAYPHHRRSGHRYRTAVVEGRPEPVFHV